MILKMKLKLKHLVFIEVVIIVIFAVSLIASRAVGATPRLAPHAVSQETKTLLLDHVPVQCRR